MAKNKTRSLILLSIFIVSYQQAWAKSDKQIMGDVQRARELAHPNNDHMKHTNTVDPSQKFRGVYYGYFPCEHCAGIKTTLSLKNRQNYLLVTQYAQASSREYYEKGKYTWDDQSNTVTLISRKDASVRKFHINNAGEIVQLSSEGEAMKGNQSDYILRRSDLTKSREIHTH